MSGAMPGELAGAAGGGAGGGKGGGGKGGGGAGGGSPADFSNTGTGLLNNLDPATMGAGTTAGLTGDPTGSLGASAAAAAGGPPLPDMAFGGPPQGTAPAPPTPPTPQAQPSLPPIGAPVPDSAFAGPPPFTAGGTPTSQGPTSTPGGPPTAGAVTSNQPRGGYGPQGVDVPAPTAGAAADIGEGGGYGPMGPAGGDLSPTLADLSRQTQTALQPRPPMAQPSPELGWDPQQPFAAPTAGAAPTGDVGGGYGPMGVPEGPPTAGAAPTGDVGGGIQGAPPAEAEQPFPPGRADVAGTPELPGGAFGGGSPTQQPTQRFDPTTGETVQAPSPPKVPTGPAQAAPGTTASTGPVSSRGQPSPFQTGVNPLKFMGDIFNLLRGNPFPLMSDLSGLAGQAMGLPPGTPGSATPGAPGAPGTATPTGPAAAPAGTQDTSKLPGAPNGPDPKPDDELGQRRKQWYAQNPNAGTFPEDSNVPQGPTKEGGTLAGGEDLSAKTKASGVTGNFFSNGKAAQAGISDRPGQNITSITDNYGHTVKVNAHAAPYFKDFLNDLQANGYKVNDVQGFVNRNKNLPGGQQGGPSEHAFGNAIDINPKQNSQGTGRGNMPANIEEIAARHGLTWGGRAEWGRYNDPMHFEWTGVTGAPGAQAAQAAQAAGNTTAAATGNGNLSGNLVNRVQQFEGYSARAYPDGSQYSIGYGTRATSPNEVIDQATAQQRLNSELGQSQASVDRFAPGLPQNVRDGLTSLDYNTGSGWQRGPIGQAIRSGDYQRAAQLIQQYHISQPGHVSRRAWEAQQVMGQ